MFSFFHGTSSAIGRRYYHHWRLYNIVLTIFTTLGLGAFVFFTLPIVRSYASQRYASPIVTTHSPAMEKYIRSEERKEVIGFLPSWMLAQNARVYPEYLDQIIYFGIGINSNGELMKRDEEGNLLLEWHYLNSPQFMDIRTRSQKTNTKILITIKNFDNKSIDTIISNPTVSRRAVTQITELVEEYNLDGIDINFEYFTATDFPTRTYLNNFLSFLQTELKRKKPNSILSFDVNASVVYDDKAYDMVKIGDIVDQIILMGYDYSRTDSSFASSVSPLYAQKDHPSIDRSITSLIGHVPEEKIILALPLYGYEWQTLSTLPNSRTVDGTGALATYRRIRDLISHQKVSISYDQVNRTPRIVYIQNGEIKQIQYDDERSLKEKIDYIKDKNLKGIGLWALGYEGAYLEPWQLIKDQIFSSE